ncbi:peptidyl-prolyl cis-trans isomerase [Plakobranchus ocellatus]|uniref:Peptidyl-prolyl cis-trans isomerase n=1 Tax=Plakobranchus ocellatus TaxID=259542 RepID=A0AAV4DKB1_9GAST|nr:peptidyl-prolyl cis-trans isomerase [Plakobranchus ocellatus]
MPTKWVTTSRDDARLRRNQIDSWLESTKWVARSLKTRRKTARKAMVNYLMKLYAKRKNNQAPLIVLQCMDQALDPF